MPYSGVPKGSELEKRIHDCTEKVLKAHSGDKDFTKSNAIAICRSRLEGALALEPVTADDIAQYSNHALLADYKPAELMKFKNAVFCRASVNRNGDAINEQGIRELRDTLSFMAIDDEHDPQRVIGFFVNPRDVDNSSVLMTDGVIYAGRFPKVAKQIQDGEKKISVEAGAQKATCTVCGGEFTSRSEYCDHIREVPYKDGAVRNLYQLRAKGGAAVLHPAWNTEFDINAITFIASQIDFEKPKNETPTWATNLIAKVEGFLERLRPVDEDNIVGGVTMSEINVDELNLEELGLVQASELETLKVDLEAKLADKDTEAEKLKVGFNRVLELGMEASQLEILADMSEDAYGLLKSQRAEASEGEVEEETAVQAGEETTQETQTQTTVLEGADIVTTVPLTWETAGSVLKLKEV